MDITHYAHKFIRHKNVRRVFAVKLMNKYLLPSSGPRACGCAFCSADKWPWERRASDRKAPKANNNVPRARTFLFCLTNGGSNFPAPSYSGGAARAALNFARFSSFVLASHAVSLKVTFSPIYKLRRCISVKGQTCFCIRTSPNLLTRSRERLLRSFCSRGGRRTLLKRKSSFVPNTHRI